MRFTSKRYAYFVIGKVKPSSELSMFKVSRSSYKKYKELGFSVRRERKSQMPKLLQKYYFK